MYECLCLVDVTCDCILLLFLSEKEKRSKAFAWFLIILVFKGYNETEGRLFTVGGTNYTLVYASVHARSAESVCQSRTGGTLAKITNQEVQEVIWKAVIDGPRLMQRTLNFWIAGKRRAVPGIKSNGVYWIKSSKFTMLVFFAMLQNVDISQQD